MVSHSRWSNATRHRHGVGMRDFLNRLVHLVRAALSVGGVAAISAAPFINLSGVGGPGLTVLALILLAFAIPELLCPPLMVVRHLLADVFETQGSTCERVVLVEAYVAFGLTLAGAFHVVFLIAGVAVSVLTNFFPGYRDRIGRLASWIRRI